MHAHELPIQLLLVWISMLAFLLLLGGVSMVTGWLLPVFDELRMKMIGIPLILSGAGMVISEIVAFHPGPTAWIIMYVSTCILLTAGVYAIALMIFDRR